MNKYLLLLPLFIALNISKLSAQQAQLENAKFYDFTIIEIKNADFPKILIDNDNKRPNPNFDAELLQWVEKNFTTVANILSSSNKITRADYLKLIPKQQAMFTRYFIPFKNREVATSDYLALKYFKTNNKAPKAGKKVVLLVAPEFYQLFTNTLK